MFIFDFAAIGMRIDRKKYVTLTVLICFTFVFLTQNLAGYNKSDSTRQNKSISDSIIYVSADSEYSSDSDDEYSGYNTDKYNYSEILHSSIQSAKSKSILKKCKKLFDNKSIVIAGQLFRSPPLTVNVH